ncbi:MAG: type II secretion system F family protein [Desulfobacterales bacterium]|nr:type II secretion system F family protein [Desulfobacterales bacterium]
MPKIEAWEKKIAWLVSAILAVMIVLTACLTLHGSFLFDEYLLLALVVGVFPPAVLDYLDYRWKRSIDEHLPDLFRSIVQAQETGMTLPQALEEASKRSYGPLTDELKKMVTKMSWGMPFEKAFRSFGNRVDTALMQRTVPLVIEASRTGGRVDRVFRPMSRFVQSILTAEKKLRAQIRPYVAIVYVAFFVFLFSIIMLFRSFFSQITEFTITGVSLLTPEAIRRLFFHMSILQAFFGGLVAGKMGEGSASAGLKHSVILLAAGYVGLKFFIGSD